MAAPVANTATLSAPSGAASARRAPASGAQGLGSVGRIVRGLQLASPSVRGSRGRSVAISASSGAGGDTSARCDGSLSRRGAMVSSAALVLSASVMAQADEAAAAGFKKELKKKDPPLEEFVQGPDFPWRGGEHEGVLFYDLEKGSGQTVKAGDTVLIHYDVKFRNIVVISSRSARLLGANRSIAEPQTVTAAKIPRDLEVVRPKKTITGVGIEVRYQGDALMVASTTPGGPAERAGLKRGDQVIAIGGKVADPDTVGIYTVANLLKGDEGTEVTLSIQKPGQVAPTDVTVPRETIVLKEKAATPAFTEGGGGLYAGPSDLKPPAAMYVGMVGMQVGGKRLIYAPDDIGYGEDGFREVPPGKACIVEVEVLKVS